MKYGIGDVVSFSYPMGLTRTGAIMNVHPKDDVNGTYTVFARGVYYCVRDEQIFMAKANFAR